MDRLSRVKLAEQGIKTNILYGTIIVHGIKTKVKDYLESDDFLKYVNVNARIDLLIKKIEELLEKEEIHFQNAYEIQNINISDSINDAYDLFISSLPYKGDINVAKDESINILDKFNAIDKNKLTLDGNDILFEIIPNKKITLKKYYKLLLENEYIRPTMIDYEELLASQIYLLKNSIKDFDYIYYSKLENGMNFNDYISNIYKNINDNFDLIINGHKYQVQSYIKDLFDYQRKYLHSLEEKYNKVNDSPISVGELSVLRGVDKKEIVTGDLPIIPSQEEKQSVLSNNSRDLAKRKNIIEEINKLIITINETNELETLEILKNKVEHYKSMNIENEPSIVKNLIDKLQDIYNKKEIKLHKIESNKDDYEELSKYKINDLIQKLNEIIKNFERSYTDPSNELKDVFKEYKSLQLDLESFGIDLHKELDEFYKKYQEFIVKSKFIRDNKKTKKERALDEVKNIYYKIHSSIINVINAGEFNGNSVGYKMSLDNDINEYTSLINKLLENNIITSEDFEKISNELNENIKFTNHELNDNRQRSIL